MKEFFGRHLLGNTIYDYVWVVGVILFVLLLNRFISKYIAIFLCKLFKRRWQTFDQQKFLELIINPLGFFLVLSVSIIALYRLDFPPELNFKVYKYPLSQVFLSLAIAAQT
ncbi:MAG TPA: hypothetical protein VHK91_07320, partial [Flavisolibacter sp.]|nr:hypothetical protein [Flavisolibacter sp.]